MSTLYQISICSFPKKVYVYMIACPDPLALKFEQYSAFHIIMQISFFQIHSKFTYWRAENGCGNEIYLRMRRAELSDFLAMDEHLLKLPRNLVEIIGLIDIDYQEVYLEDSNAQRKRCDKGKNRTITELTSIKRAVMKNDLS